MLLTFGVFLKKSSCICDMKLLCFFLSLFFFLNLHFEEELNCCILLRGDDGWTGRGDATVSAHQVTPHQQSSLCAELFSISSPIFSQSQESCGRFWCRNCILSVWLQLLALLTKAGPCQQCPCPCPWLHLSFQPCPGFRCGPWLASHL